MLASPPARPPHPILNRNLIIVGSVLLLHALGLWALQAGLVQRIIERVVQVDLVTDFITPPKPKPVPPPPPPKVEPPKPREAVRTPTPAPPPPPQPVAIADTTPAPNAATGVTTPQPPPPPIGVPTAPAPPAPPAPPPPPKIELPSSNAQYLQNTPPNYPSISKRLGEQGKVLVHVLIGPDGAAQKAEVQESSGYTRLDKVALDTVLHWRYVPGKRGGVPEAMWFVVPINFVLE